MSKPTKPKEIVIVSGLSGSGKTIALRALEDIGHYCIDNLPLALLEDLIKVLSSGESYSDRVALVMDTRDPGLMEQGKQTFERLLACKFNIKIVFLLCSDKKLIQRFNETQRAHPLARDGRVEDGIEREKKMMEWIRDMADFVIDTSETNAQQLREYIRERFIGQAIAQKFTLHLVSFGFRYGPPHDTHLMLDVRFLQNPHWVEGLRAKSGREPEIQEYIFGFTETGQFLKRIVDLLTFLLPFYRKKGRQSLTVAVGCTGGRHRSVAMVEALARQLESQTVSVTVHHRDILMQN